MKKTLNPFSEEVSDKLILPYLITLILIVIGGFSITRSVDNISYLLIIYSSTLIICSSLELFFNLSNINYIPHPRWSICFNIITFILAVLLISEPTIEIEILGFYIGLYIIFKTFISINHGISYYQVSPYFGKLMLLLGFLMLVFSSLLIWTPAAMKIFYPALIGVSFVLTGFYTYSNYKIIKNLNSSKKN